MNMIDRNVGDWNTRPSEDKLQAEIDRLQEEVAGLEAAVSRLVVGILKSGSITEATDAVSRIVGGDNVACFLRKLPKRKDGAE